MNAVPTPTATVVVCSRDRPEMLDRLLSSLREFTPGADVLVVDSASRDGRTHEVAARHGVRCVRVDVPGLSIARNRGLRHADGEVVVFTDDDCIVRNRWYEPLLDQFSDERVGVATGVMGAPSSFDHQTAPPHGRPRRTTRTARGLDLGHGANMAFRKDAVLEAGGFDERLGAGTHWGGAEDLDMFCRLLHLGWGAVHVPASRLWHVNERVGADRTRLVRAYARGTGAMVAKWVRLDRTVGAEIGLLTTRRALLRAVAARGDQARRDETRAHLTGLVAGSLAGAASPIRGYSFEAAPAERDGGAPTTFLRPVEERFLRSLPGSPPQVTTSVHTTDGTGLRDGRGAVDLELVRRLWDRSAPAAPILRTRLVVPAHRMLPPAWVPVALVPAAAFSVLPDVTRDRIDDVLSEMETQRFDATVSPFRVLALDHPDGGVTIVGRAMHAWADGAGGLAVLRTIFRTRPSEPVGLTDPGPTGPSTTIALTLFALRGWWRKRRAGSGHGIPLTRARARRFLGRWKWWLVSARISRAPIPARAMRRTELPFGNVSRTARQNGGGVTDLLVVAAARAQVMAGGADPASPVEVRVAMAAGPKDPTAGGNQVRIVHAAVDTAAPLSDSVRAVRAELRPGRTQPTTAPKLHATLMVGPRDDQFLGRAKVESWTLLPSLAPDEDLSVLGLVSGDRLIVSVATRFPERLPVYEEQLRMVLGGATP